MPSLGFKLILPHFAIEFALYASQIVHFDVSVILTDRSACIALGFDLTGLRNLRMRCNALIINVI